MAFLIGGANSAVDDAYSIDNSVLFNEGDSATLKRTKGTSETSTQKATWSFWIKVCDLGSDTMLYSNSVEDDSNRGFFVLTSDYQLRMLDDAGETRNMLFLTSAIFRDPAAWYHFVIAIDTTQGTAANRVKIYVNGTQLSSSEFTTETYPNQNTNLKILTGTSNANQEFVGGIYNSSDAGNMRLAEFFFCDGQQYAASVFGEFDEDSPTIWKPKDCKDDLTFGTNGYYLDFEDSDNLGDDESGNTNDFTENNLAATDQSTDTCTNNFATLNPLYKDTNVTYSEGNLQHVNSASWEPGWSTIAVSSGKWYFESKFTAVTESANNAFIGVCLVSEEDGLNLPGNSANSYGYENNGNKKTDSTGTSYGDTWTVNDIVGCYLDLDNGAIYFSKNGTVQASGDPTSGASKTNAAYTFTPAGDYVLGISNYYGTQQVNYGNPVHSISSGNSDPNGYGNFEYDESGYYALCTKNLAEIGG